MTAQRNKILIYTIICLSLFLALLPVILSNNYLRQDDMKTGMWWGMSMADEGPIYYNTVHQLVRPICMILFFITDMLSIDLHYAVYARLASIINVCFLGVLLYRWQLLFNSSRMLAASFAIAAFTLPGIQVFAATANYFLIIFAILMAFAGPFYWYKSFNCRDEKEKKKYFWIGNSIFFMSYLTYPVASMYSWVMLGIGYLNSLNASEGERKRLERFVWYASKLTLAMTAFYFVFLQIYHKILHVQMYGRVGTTNLLEILSRFTWIFGVFSRDSALWLYGTISNNYSMALIIVTLLFALLKTNFSIRIFKELAILAIFFFMCYSPMLAGQQLEITFRYTLATMPLLLYILFWSIQKISPSAVLANLIFAGTAIFGVYFSNLMLTDGIVGPQTNDFRYIKAELSQKVLPLIKQNKLVALHVIDCTESKYEFEKGIPYTLEYAMRLCQIPHHLVGGVSHGLMALGVTSNRRRGNMAFSDGKLFVLQDVPWGNIIINGNENVDMNHLDYPADKMTVVTIDMRKVPPYKHLDLYRDLGII